MKTLLCFLLLAVSAFGETLYFSQSGAGSHNGSSLGNAWSLAEANTAGNWGAGAGKVSAGDTLTVFGTITGTLTAAGDGSAGNVVTILFDTGAKFSAATFTTGSGAIVVSGRQYVTVDGGATGSIGGYGAAGTINGLIEATANGTGLANTNDISGVFGRDCQHIEVKNLQVKNMYVRPSGSDTNGYGYGVNIGFNGGTGPSDIKATNCLFSDMYIGVYLDYGPSCVGYVCDRVTASNVNWGIAGADHGATSAGSGFAAHDCYLHDFVNWDQPGNQFHHNGIYYYAESGGSIADILIYSVVVGPNFSVGSPNNATSGIFVSGAGITGTVQVRNSIFREGASDTPSNGLIFIWPGATAVVGIYNNTFVGGGTGNAIQPYGGRGTAGQQSFTIKNNLCTGKTFINVANNATITLVADYNLGDNLVSGQEYSYSANGSSVFKSFAQWQALGFDTHGLSSNPMLNLDYTLQAGSPAIAAGTNLSGIFTTDFDGVTRSAWDMGAKKYTAAAAPTLPGRPRSLGAGFAGF